MIRELGPDAREVFPNLRRLQDLDPSAEPRQLTRERPGRPAADLDVHPSVRFRLADRQTGPERRPKPGERLGLDAGRGSEGHPALVELGDDRAPVRLEVEAVRPLDRILGERGRPDATEAERAHPGIGARDQVPDRRLRHQAERVHRPLRLRAVRSRVDDPGLHPLDDRPLQDVQLRGRWHVRTVPARGVDHHGGGGRLSLGAERLGQGADELAERRLDLRRRRGRRSRHQEQGPSLGRGQPAQVRSRTPEQRPATAPTGLRVDGMPAIARPSRSRRAVRSEISSSSASSAAVTRPRAWRISRTATRRSARTVPDCHRKRPEDGHFDRDDRRHR